MLDINYIIENDKFSYKIEKEIGRGGFGLTYYAIRQQDNLPVAVKVLSIQKLTDWKSLDLFEREIRILKNLSHPNIPDYLDSFELGEKNNPNGIVLIQEFIDGKSLRNLIEEKKTMTEKEIISWFTQILDVLDYLHTLHPPVIHRDITPKNILLTNEGKAFLVDFGSVQAAVSASKTALTMAGTFGFAPMEQFIGRALPASDLYGLAMTCLSLASHLELSDMPFEGNRVLVKKIVDFDARFNLLLEQMTEPEVDKRLSKAKFALGKLKHLFTSYEKKDKKSIPLYQISLKDKKSLSKSKDQILSEEKLWPIPFKEIELKSMKNSCCLSDYGNVLAVDNKLIDTSNMQLLGMLTEGLNFVRILGMTPSADLVFASTNYDQPILGFGYTDKGYQKIYEIKDESMDNPYKIKVSPNGKLLLIYAHMGFFLVDVEAGSVIQKIDIEDIEKPDNMTFNADGSLIAYSYLAKTFILGQDGSKKVIKDSYGISFSQDGKSIVLFREENLEIGPITGLDNQKDLKKIPIGDFYKTGGNFSPDCRFYVYFDNEKNEILVIDVATASITSRIKHPTGSDESFGLNSGWNSLIGFSSDSSQIFCSCNGNPNKFIQNTDNHDSILIWRTSDGNFLGSIAYYDTENYDNNIFQGDLLALSSTGFYAPLIIKDIKNINIKMSFFQRRYFKKRFFSKKKYKKFKKDPWYKPDVTFRTIKGEPAEFLLNEEDKLQLLNLEERWDFYSELVKSDKLENKADLTLLIEESRGLSHFLELILDQAEKIQKSKTTFGSSKEKVKLTQNIMIQAIQELKSRPKDELYVLYHDFLEKKEENL